MKKLSNNKVFNTKVQEYIKAYKQDYTLEGLRHEIKSLETQTCGLFMACQRWVQGGMLACYYSDVAQDLADLFKCSVDRIWEIFDDNECDLWDYYVNLMSRELCHLVEGERVYIQW